MKAEELQNRVLASAESFGFKKKTDELSNGNAIFRCNLKDEKGANYFGFIRPEEQISGAYSDFSLVVFPGNDANNVTGCLVAFVVGSSGFTNDYDLATRPGIRRAFLDLLSDDRNASFCKVSFTDIETRSDDLVNFIAEHHPEFGPVAAKYGTVLPAARYVDLTDIDKAMEIVDGWLARYAKIRNWATNKRQRDAIESAIAKCVSKPAVDDEAEIRELLRKRRYVVLQGAPGTGKTYTSNRIAADYRPENVLFVQFHAETTYPDFIYGIEPDVHSGAEGVKFKQKEGTLYRAVKRALELKKQGSDDRVLLIIDEINRANLSSVLGPVFYLFEPGGSGFRAKIKIGNMELESLPDNIDVLATMNTADRSLAVVDFALRRRFAWYTMKPHVLESEHLGPDAVFRKDVFLRFDDIFRMHATDEELSLQPGHSYFIARPDDDEDFRNRLQYELMPLIKEYLIQGYMPKAKESFSNLFYELLHKHLFE